jgi:gamma-glutamylcyclotransferase (GGCT)/AIG2-like uncharacterized protein YtfP
MTEPKPAREYVLFVYDSLMSGEAQHELLAATRPLGAARTTAEYELVDLGPSGAMLADGRGVVLGEVYALEAKALAAIDVHKGHPVLHQRSTVRLDDGREAQAYLLSPDQARGLRRIRSGDWRQRSGTVTPRHAGGELVRWARNRFKPPRS